MLANMQTTKTKLDPCLRLTTPLYRADIIVSRIEIKNQF